MNSTLATPTSKRSATPTSKYPVTQAELDTVRVWLIMKVNAANKAHVAAIKSKADSRIISSLARHAVDMEMALHEVNRDIQDLQDRQTDERIALRNASR